MIHINWQDEPLHVTRLVFRRGLSPSFEADLDSLVTRLELQTAEDNTDPRPGDFWIGCHPRAGWGDDDPRLIGWASAVEAPLAIGLLRSSAAAVSSCRPTILLSTPRSPKPDSIGISPN